METGYYIVSVVERLNCQPKDGDEKIVPALFKYMVLKSVVYDLLNDGKVTLNPERLKVEEFSIETADNEVLKQSLHYLPSYVREATEVKRTNSSVIYKVVDASETFLSQNNIDEQGLLNQIAKVL